MSNRDWLQQIIDWILGIFGGYDEDDEPLEDEDVQEEVNSVFKEFKVSSFDIMYKYYGQLEAPGYMDQTDYVLGDSQAEVAQQLLDLQLHIHEILCSHQTHPQRLYMWHWSS